MIKRNPCGRKVILINKCQLKVHSILILVAFFWEDLMEFKQKEGQKALISLCDSLKAWIDFAIYQK